jgi:hypothetical protein
MIRSLRYGHHVLLACCIITSALTLASGPSIAGSPVNTGSIGGIAIMGYDPVAYFTEGRAVKGSPEVAYDWLGATWNFVNPQHKELFADDPVRYAPQYGGYCAVGTAYGSTVSIDPDAWRIINGKLYLFGGKQGAANWESDYQSYVTRADENWPAIEAELKQE